MATYSKLNLSQSVNGQSISVTGNSNSATTLIHTAVSGTTNWDEIYVYAYNGHTADVTLTIQWGGTATADESILTLGYKKGFILVIPGFLLNNSKLVRAYAGTANVVTINGFVNQITA